MLTVNADFAFRMGKTHDVCEDYATSKGVSDGFAIAVADGCSSSPNSDIGARIVAHHTLDLCRGFKHKSSDYMSFFREVLKKSEDTVRTIDVDIMALDATLLLAVATEDQLSVLMYGDGVAVVKYNDGRISIFNSIYSSGYPNFPSYLLDSSRKTQIDALQKRKLEEVTINQATISSEVKENRVGDYEYFNFNFEKDGIEYVSLFSDGIHSFGEVNITETSRVLVPLKYTQVLNETLKFKGFHGAFVKRRVNKFMEFTHANDWQHYDDFSIGALAFYEL